MFAQASERSAPGVARYAAQGIAFADLLPGVLRAIFVYRWPIDAAALPFGDRQSMAREAQQVRPDHNLTPDHCIEAVAWALHRHVDHRALARCLESIGPEAVAFWHVEVNDPRELERRIT